MKYRVKIAYPNSYFSPGDILVAHAKIPPGCFGKFIDETTGWAWVQNPEKYPDVFEEVWD
jgi:hypothetical protein